jgi:hypothetical protein
VQKNGGNVAGYFCTPEGFVLNAVVGPVSADKLLDEARWTVGLDSQLGKGRGDWEADADRVAEAHQVQAGDRVHALLAQTPLAPLPAIQETVFTGLANERVTSNRELVQGAAERLKVAAQEGMPVLFVLVNPGNLGAASALTGQTAALLDELAQPPLRGAVRNCKTIVLPIDQLAALSNLAHVPTFDLAERTTPTMVLADSQGKQLQAIRRSTPPPELADRLWRVINGQRFQKAQQLLADRQYSAAKRILGMLQATPVACPEKALARRQWVALKAGRRPQPEDFGNIASPFAAETR